MDEVLDVARRLASKALVLTARAIGAVAVHVAAGCDGIVRESGGKA